MRKPKAAKDCTAAFVRDANDALTCLSPHEQLLLRLRFGIGGPRLSPTAIARRFGLRPQDVEILETRALTHLRQIAMASEVVPRLQAREG